MAVKVHFQFLGKFAIFADGQPCITAFGGKQIAVLKTLVLQREKGLAFDRLSEELNMNGVNPRNALKTLISRTRAKLNAISDGLGAVIASQKGMYFFKDVPGVTVDFLEILEVLEQLGTNPEPAQVMDLTECLLSLYKGELEGEYWLHMEYLNAKTVGCVIQKTRENKGLSQEVVSGLADIGRTHLSAIERGERKPTLETFFRLADALSMRASALMEKIETAVSQEKQDREPAVKRKR